jgi:hypothetical protein
VVVFVVVPHWFGTLASCMLRHLRRIFRLLHLGSGDQSVFFTVVVFAVFLRIGLARWHLVVYGIFGVTFVYCNFARTCAHLCQPFLR